MFKSSLLKLSRAKKTLTSGQCLIIALTIGEVSFLTRLFFPDGFVVFNVQLSCVPQYVFYFFAGVILSKTGVTQLAEHQKILPWLLPSFVLLGVLAAAISLLLATEPFRGGTNPYAIFYSFAQGFLSVALSITCLVFFHRVANRSLYWDGYPARAAYGAFFIHALVLVTIAIAIKSLIMAPMLKFLILSVLGVPVSFICGYVLARLPILRYVF